jgi:putative two-component system response regulator
MAIADVYDALVSRRVYKPPLPHSKAVSIIIEGRSTHFDPELIDAFEALAEDLRSIALEFSDDEEERKALCS